MPLEQKLVTVHATWILIRFSYGKRIECTDKTIV